MNTLKRRMQIDGQWLTLQATSDQGTGAPIVRAYQATGLQHVTGLLLTFPMRSIESARQFVTGADEAVFRRAYDKLQEQSELVAMFNNGLEVASGRINKGASTPPANQAGRYAGGRSRR